MTEQKRKIAKQYPHACPVCRGRGELTEELAQHESIVKYDLADHKIYSCHVCQGSCLIWEIREEDAPEELVPNTGTIFPGAGQQISIPSIQIPQPVINPQIVGPWVNGSPVWKTVSTNDYGPKE